MCSGGYCIVAGGTAGCAFIVSIFSLSQRGVVKSVKFAFVDNLGE